MPFLPPDSSSYSPAYPRSVYQWLQQDELHEKHRRWRHPTVALFVHYIVVGLVSFSSHDWIVTNASLQQPKLQQQIIIPFCLMAYATAILLWRLVIFAPNTYILYEYCWLCNVTLHLSAAALYFQRPLIAQACCVTVGIDQLLWYVDLLGFVWTGGHCPIGVAQYALQPETSWASRITATHHLWTIPLLLYATDTYTVNSNNQGLSVWALPLSAILMVANVAASRFLTPHTVLHLDASSSKSPTKTRKAINVNLAHALWKDITFDCLQINYDHPTVWVYLWRLLWRWQAFNTLVFLVLRGGISVARSVIQQQTAKIAYLDADTP